MLHFPAPLRVLLVLACVGFAQFAAAQAIKPASLEKALSKRAALQSARKQAPQLAPLAELSNEQLELANHVVLGKMPCELGAHVSVRPDARGAGRFVLELGTKKFAMVPVVSKTGAIRLEDEAAGVVWLQLANKSMLMSQKQGKRLADACANSDQLIVARELERNPAPSLLDAPVILQAAFAPPDVIAVEQAVAQ